MIDKPRIQDDVNRSLSDTYPLSCFWTLLNAEYDGCIESWLSDCKATFASSASYTIFQTKKIWQDQYVINY